MSDGSQTPPVQPPGGSGWLPPSAPGSEPTAQWQQASGPSGHQPPPAAPYPPQGAPYPPPPANYPPPPGYTWAPLPAGPSRPTDGRAIAALVVGLSSLVFTVMALGILFIFTIPGGIVAWVLGRKAARMTATSPQDDPAKPGGRTLAQVGMWTGIASIVLSVLAVIVYGLIIAFAGELNLEDLETDDSDEPLFSSTIAVIGLVARLAVALT